MKNNLLIIFILLITGCSKQLPECSSEEILDLIRSSYHENNRNNSELTDLKFEMTTTISTDKETGSKNCITNATATFKNPVIELINAKENEDLNLAIGLLLGETRFVRKTEVQYSIFRDEQTEVQYSIFRDEQNSSYFIKYNNNWTDNLDFGFVLQVIKSVIDNKKSGNSNKESENTSQENTNSQIYKEFRNAKKKWENSNKESKDSRNENTYLQVDKEFSAKFKDSKRAMVVQIALMTQYDNRVFDNFKKHEFVIRSEISEVMRQTTEADASHPDFRANLASKIKNVINNILKKYEDFGGIEDVFFTSFVMQ